MSAVTAPDDTNQPGEVRTLLLQGQPDPNDSETVQVEAQRDVHIIGWSTGDTSSNDKNFHQFVKCWLGGSLPGENDPSPGAYAHDDEGFLFEFDMTIESDGAGFASQDNDGQTTMFPKGHHIPWNEGVTLNAKFINTTDQGDSDFMDVVLYYVVVNGGGTALA